jgi:peptide/nickel transport system ATP-binding protein
MTDTTMTIPNAARPGGAPILEVTDLGVDFWVDGTWYPAAIHMNYDVKPGEVLAIVGESGSGKSSSSMALLGLLPSNSRVTGSVKLRGREILNLNERQLRAVRGNDVAVIFQEPMTALNPVYTVGFQIVETLRLHMEMSPADAKKRAIELLEMVEMPDPEISFNKYPHQFSGGQRQRAMIAMSIACDPVLLVADEPTTALDVTVQAEILDLMRDLRHRLESAIVLITHDMGVVADLADKIIVMKDGEIVEAGPIHKIFTAPEHPYTQQLLAAVPHLGTGQAEVTEALVEAEKEHAEPVLKLDRVGIEYPKHGRVPAFRAVDDVSFEINPGEIVGLVGESGSGKTTIGRAAVGLLPVAGGVLTINGHDVGKASPRELRDLRRKIGIVFQDPGSSLNPRFPIGQSIGEPLLLAKQAKGKELDRMVENLLDQVELPRSFRNRYPHELSGGQRQRVGIARALALSPSLLIADEPTSALDVSVQARFLELLQGIQQELQFACLFVSHDLAVVDLLAHRIAVMRKGHLVEFGTRDEILRAPKDPYTQRLIAAVPVPDPTAQKERREARTAAIEQIRLDED